MARAPWRGVGLPIPSRGPPQGAAGHQQRGVTREEKEQETAGNEDRCAIGQGGGRDAGWDRGVQRVAA